MKVIEGKILLDVKKGCVEKIGEFQISADSKEYEIGTVLSVGEKVTEVKVNDTVYFYKSAGHTITHEGKQYRIITSSEVLVII